MKIIAHRGASGTRVENTLEAFDKAIADGCDAIELDVQFHPSGALVVSHDAYVMYNGQVEQLRNLSLEQIESITFHDGSKLTLLEPALRLIAGRCEVNIEVKSASLFCQQHRQGRIEQAISAIKTIIDKLVTEGLYRYQQLSISSFNHHVLATSKVLLPKVNTGALSASCPVDYADFAAKLQATTINLAIDCINHAIVEHAHNAGLQVWVYTVNNQQDIKWCMALGVDAIFTDFPERSREIIEDLVSRIK
ncbi:glycerophosphodiester phosphodiesterase [Thalassotalea sp. LPB0316]|uniref:glycerophosphodiester phosphodiesterase n=1 Tax=Thalassotalea sp. LPB0316 TaxID=2769490 RepID=UPI00186850C5|nr:glycerophosphodiester phosphodiesterase family protein [Thalassotalea sp. LPB0316]QOL26523.1 glycerophosphodiester phosphodiesterase [Thalassotalea sp. LPB0316]